MAHGILFWGNDFFFVEFYSMRNHLFFRQNQFAFWKTAINRLTGNFLFLNESNYLNVNEWQIG